jgi:ABC-2 type transport system ATP-binding protein
VLRDQGKTILISSHILTELGEMCDSLIFMDSGRVMHHGDTTSMLRHGTTAGACTVDIVVDGPVAPLLEWLSLQSQWKLIEEHRTGARAEFVNNEPSALAAELRRLITAGVAVADFHREARRLDEAFVAMLREPSNPDSIAPSRSGSLEEKS